MPHFRLYIIEAALLGVFMLSACTFGTLLFHPGSPVARRVRRLIVRRAIMGAAMGGTAVIIITSPWGRESGAHINPATTLAFAILGKIAPADAVGYAAGQFTGGVAGVLAARAMLGPALAHAAVNFVITRPGAAGRAAAFAAEAAMTFVLLMVVLVVSNTASVMAFTPAAVALLVAVYITFIAPVSGMSLNPARSLGSAAVARDFRHLPIYFIAPPLGMLAAAAVYTSAAGIGRVHCAKLDHRGTAPCPFHCTIDVLRDGEHPDGISRAHDPE